MPSYETLANGSLMEVRRPWRGVPFFSDWLEALALRRAAFLSGGRLIPYTAVQEQACEIMDDGTVRLVCIGCAGLIEAGQWSSYSKPRAIRQGAKALRGKSQSSLSHYEAQAGMARILVGGLIQRRLEEPCNERIAAGLVTVVQRWSRMTVTHRGIGCPECQALYQAEVRRVSAENESKAALVECMRMAYMQKGLVKEAQAVQSAKELTPWLDIMSGSVTTQQFTPAMERRL